MTDSIAAVKDFVTGQLQMHCEPIAPRTATSQQRHLSVWRTLHKGRPIGLENGHKEVLNLWVTAMTAPKILPETVEVARKVWTGSGWKDAVPDPNRISRDGANSNLKPFEVFNTRPIVRLGIRSVDDARAILEHLFA